MTDDLPPPTAPEIIPVQVYCFDDRDRSERFGNIVAEDVRALSRMIDLSRLAGISIATDFDAALLELDRGVETTTPLTRTRNEVAEGVAMAPMVRRDGINKWHLMLNAPHFIALEEKNESTALDLAVHLLAHECAHVQISAHFDEKFPDRYGLPWKTDEEAILLQPMLAIWEEYAANCLAGPFCTEFCQRYSEDTLVGYLGVARKNYQSGLERFYQHKNWLMFFEDAGRAIFEPLRGLAYVLGDMDGASLDWTAFPAARKLLDADPVYNCLAVPLHNELKKVAENWNEWNSLEVFAPLMKIALSLYCEMGIIIKQYPSGRLDLSIN